MAKSEPQGTHPKIDVKSTEKRTSKRKMPPEKVSDTQSTEKKDPMTTLCSEEADASSGNAPPAPKLTSTTPSPLSETNTNNGPDSPTQEPTPHSSETNPKPQTQTSSSPPLPHLQTPQTASLTTKLTTLHTQIASLESELSLTYTKLDPKSCATASDAAADADAKASAILTHHIALLKSYNDIKDVGLGLMGLLADARGVRLGVVLEGFGVGDGD
jgi:DNA repair protein Swi5/Sae3